MKKVKVGVVGYGTIGQRLADGVSQMGDMELVGVANRTPNLGVRALKEKGMPYDLYMSDPKYADAYAEAGVPVCGTLENLAEQCDILLMQLRLVWAQKIRSCLKKWENRVFFRAARRTM